MKSENPAGGDNPEPQVVAATPEPQPEPSKKHCEVTCKTKRDWIDKGALILEAVGLVVLIGYTIFTGLMYFSNRKAADAAKSAADTAKKQLEMSERPWMSAEFSIDHRIEFQPNGDMGVRLHVVMKNIGHSVATDVRLVLGADPEGSGFWYMKVPKEQKEMCEMWRKATFPSENGSWTTLFPGESYLEDVSFRVTKEQIDKVKLQAGGKEFITGISFFGCVDYSFAFAAEHHQTGFNYDLLKIDHLPTHPAKFNEVTGGALSMNIGANIPASQLTVRRSIFGGFYVD